MITKLVSYILSKRRTRKLMKLHALHKMQQLTRIERAIRACEMAMDIITEPTLRTRVHTLIDVKAPTYIAVYRELELLRNAVKSVVSEEKYITLPDWTLYETRAELVDAYFKTESEFIGVKPALGALIDILKEIQAEMPKPYNVKFVEFYNSKPHRIYTEIYDIAVGVSENV